MDKKKWFVTLLMPFLIFLGFVTMTADTVQAKELQNVITSVELWNSSNGRTETTNSKGAYVLALNANYRFVANFDLSAYDGNLNDGDTFSFTIPAPITVAGETFDLTDKETSTVVGEA